MLKKRQENWTLILNPHAGGGKGKHVLKEIEKILQKNDFLYGILVSQYPGHAITLAKEAVTGGATQIIVAGGDGTLNEVVNGVFQQTNYPPEALTIAIIPVGTGNDWIKTFKIPNSVQGAIDKIKAGKTLRQDVGKLTFWEKEQEHSRYFLNMAGFGFDALAACKANKMKAKGRSGFMVYLQSLISAFLHYQTQKVQITLDGTIVEDLIFSTSVAIGKFNGGGMMQAPGAVPNNGIFEVTLIKKIGLWGIITNLAGLYKGTFIKDKRVSTYRAREVIISSENPLAGEVDGESLGKHRFHIQMLPQKLQVIVGEMES